MTQWGIKSRNIDWKNILKLFRFNFITKLNISHLTRQCESVHTLLEKTHLFYNIREANVSFQSVRCALNVALTFISFGKMHRLLQIVGELFIILVLVKCDQERGIQSMDEPANTDTGYLMYFRLFWLYITLHWLKLFVRNLCIVWDCTCMTNIISNTIILFFDSPTNEI